MKMQPPHDPVPMPASAPASAPKVYRSAFEHDAPAEAASALAQRTLPQLAGIARQADQLAAALSPLLAEVKPEIEAAFDRAQPVPLARVRQALLAVQDMAAKLAAS